MAKKRWFWRSVGWFAAVCIALELFLRLFGYGSYTIFRPDPRLLWVPEPGNKLTVVNHQRININGEGFRYPIDLGPKQPGQFRVFTFGDSVTMGWGVDDEHHYSADLEKALNGSGCSGTHFQVVSAGVNAYPNSLVDERMKTVLESNLQPDLVVLAYSFNTGMENLAHLQGAQRQKILRGVAFKSLARRSAIYDFLVEDLLRNLAYYRFRELMIQGTWDTARQKADDPVEEFTANLQSAVDESRARHVPLVLLLLSSENQTSQLHPYQKAMIDFAQINHLPLVNMFEAWRTEDHHALFMDHVHPSALGHQQIADALAQTIRTLPSEIAACQSSGAEKSVASK
ncbi:MAG TPA: SGNH/GDSL hydrolase family protein [Terriglobales bacterium]|jgi:lysophospholipase L1-like esterase|nr:SGNH/GDSL hydrolase family protein [Terriglobales bacterium]